MVPAVSINYLAVLVAAIASIVLGFVWYGPLFGKTWTQLMGFDKKKMDDMKKKGMGAKTWIFQSTLCRAPMTIAQAEEPSLMFWKRLDYLLMYSKELLKMEN